MNKVFYDIIVSLIPIIGGAMVTAITWVGTCMIRNLKSLNDNVQQIKTTIEVQSTKFSEFKETIESKHEDLKERVGKIENRIYE